VKSVVGLRRGCASCIRVYLSGEIRAGDMAALVGVWTPIMYLPMVFHGEVDATREEYGASQGVESLSVSPSRIMIWRRPLIKLGGSPKIGRGNA